MIAGSVDMSDPYCAAIASRLGVVVGSVEYRLAPEHPYPAPLEDCYTGLHWIWTVAAELGIDRTQLAIGGGSAGGLAAGLALLGWVIGNVRVISLRPPHRSRQRGRCPSSPPLALG